MSPEKENKKYTKPCRVDHVTLCVQSPEEDPCGCEWCEDCSVNIKFQETQ
ncbi:hypothetical protein LCGC14_1185830 [marine sediment metagenome]|uniref:Uncharacterized protein n=1 Tax=marine sediment metagenome TaxID=412755 RepID=A0A0F9P3P0_9ZZZZ